MLGLLATYALTYGGAVASLVDPFLGVLIYVAFALLKPEALWEWSVPQGGNYSRIVGVALLVGWVLHGFGRWEFGRARPVAISLICFFAWTAISALFAQANTQVAMGQIEEYAKIVLPFLVGLTTINSIRQLKQLAWVIVLAQGYVAYEFNLFYLTFPGFDPNSWMFGTVDRNVIAITMVTSLGLAGFMGLHATRWWEKAVLLPLGGLMTHVVLFSMSRGGMLALIATALIALILIPKRPSYLALMALGLIVGLRLAGPAVFERLGTIFVSEQDRDYSAQSRVDLWIACIQVMLSHPILGIGPNNWRLVAHNYGFTPGKDSHTLWLHIGAEMGIPGLVFLILFYATCCVALWKFVKPKEEGLDPWYPCAAHMVISALVGFAISAQFVSVYGAEIPFYVTLVGAGTLKVYGLNRAEAEDGRPELAEEAEPTPSPVGIEIR